MIDVVGTPPDGHTTWLVLLRPTRADWPAAMTTDEEAALVRHFHQLQELTEAGTCVVAGPTLDAQIGLCVLDGLPLARLRAIFEVDAMVEAGYFRAEVRALRLSLERAHPA